MNLITIIRTIIKFISSYIPIFRFNKEERSIINENIMFSWSFHKIIFMEENQDYEKFYCKYYKNKKNLTVNKTYFECTTGILLQNLEKLGVNTNFENLKIEINNLFGKKFRTRFAHFYEIESCICNDIKKSNKISNLSYSAKFLQSIISVHLLLFYKENLLSTKSINYIILAAKNYKYGYYVNLYNNKIKHCYENLNYKHEQWQPSEKNFNTNNTKLEIEDEYVLCYINILEIFIYEVEKYIQPKMLEYYNNNQFDEVSETLRLSDFKKHISEYQNDLLLGVLIKIYSWIGIFFDQKHNIIIEKNKIYLYKQDDIKMEMLLKNYFYYRFGRKSFLVEFLTNFAIKKMSYLISMFCTNFIEKSAGLKLSCEIYIYRH